MRYLDTKAITVHIYAEQKCMLERIKKDIENEFKIKIPLTELIRQALDEGIPRIKGKNKLKSLLG